MGRPSKASRLSVVHVSAEYWPYAQTGGLAEAVRGLAEFQARSQQPVAVLLPLYRTVAETGVELEAAGPPFTVATGTGTETARLFTVAGWHSGPRVWFIDHPAFFDRPGIYGENAQDYPDNCRRFAFFCRAVAEVLPRLIDGPTVVHAHDWHAALVLPYLRTTLAGDPRYDRLGGVLTVHNAGFQGHFPPESLAEVGLPDELYDWRWMEWYGRVNWLKGGVVFADMVTTVSPSHARELCTPVGGFGLHDLFQGLGDRLVGILNGIDVDLWDPANDPHITARYTRDDLSGKKKCKAALQRAFHLPVRARTPLFALSARLVSQKGLDLLIEDHELLGDDAHFVVLGDGEERYRAALTRMAHERPDRLAVEFDFSDRMEHRLLAGADVLLMPSLYEPCGLTQMRAMRYGTVPVARRVGGLADTIEDGVTGFLFDGYSPDAFEAAIRQALAQYADQAAWTGLMREAMRREFGWKPSAARYQETYLRALAAHPAAA